MAQLRNEPISHCPNGQGGRTFSRMRPGGKKYAPPGHAPNEAHKRTMFSKTEGPKDSRERFPHGKYYDWYNDPDGLNAKLGYKRLDKK